MLASFSWASCGSTSSHFTHGLEVISPLRYPTTTCFLCPCGPFCLIYVLITNFVDDMLTSKAISVTQWCKSAVDCCNTECNGMPCNNSAVDCCNTECFAGGRQFGANFEAAGDGRILTRAWCAGGVRSIPSGNNKCYSKKAFCGNKIMLSYGNKIMLFYGNKIIKVGCNCVPRF